MKNTKQNQDRQKAIDIQTEVINKTRAGLFPHF